jgi:hypothetical protein
MTNRGTTILSHTNHEVGPKFSANLEGLEIIGPTVTYMDPLTPASWRTNLSHAATPDLRFAIAMLSFCPAFFLRNRLATKQHLVGQAHDLAASFRIHRQGAVQQETTSLVVTNRP